MSRHRLVVVVLDDVLPLDLAIPMHVFAREAPAVPPADDTIAAAQQWMLTSLAEPLTVAQMAARARMSERSFHRHFTQRAGAAPLSWLRDQRLARTKELLEGTDLPVEQIAGQVGLGTSANLRTQFHRATSLSPQECRRRSAFASGPA